MVPHNAWTEPKEIIQMSRSFWLVNRDSLSLFQGALYPLKSWLDPAQKNWRSMEPAWPSHKEWRTGQNWLDLVPHILHPCTLFFTDPTQKMYKGRCDHCNTCTRHFAREFSLTFLLTWKPPLGPSLKLELTVINMPIGGKILQVSSSLLSNI